MCMPSTTWALAWAEEKAVAFGEGQKCAHRVLEKAEEALIGIYNNYPISVVL